MSLYGCDLTKAIRLVTGQESQYAHQLEGLARHAGLSFAGKALRLHLLYELDLRDPLLPLGHPTAKRLPFYFPFVYDRGEIAYQVVSDDQIRVLRFPVAKRAANWPYKNYPASFPQRPVALQVLDYDLRKTIALACKTHECGDLLQRALSKEDQQLLNQIGWPHTFAQIGGPHWLLQGGPHYRCPNAACGEGEERPWMHVLAVVWNRPAAGISLWGEWGDFVQVIWEICPECYTLAAYNACD